MHATLERNRELTSLKKMAPLRAHSVPSLQRNLESVAWLRVLTVVVVASAAGILGVSGVLGFALYVGSHLVLQALVALRMQGDPSAYTLSTSLPFWLIDGVADNILPYLVVWSFTSALLS